MPEVTEFGNPETFYEVFDPEHQPKERILTETFREISLKLCTILSYRQAVETMNRLLHRNHQKEHRTPENEKQGAFVWNTVVTIEKPKFTHTLTNTRMRRTFCNTLAYLLEHDLLNKKHLLNDSAIAA